MCLPWAQAHGGWKRETQDWRGRECGTTLQSQLGALPSGNVAKHSLKYQEGEQSTWRHLYHWYISVPEHPWKMNKLEPNKWHSRSPRCQGIRNLSQDLLGKVRKVLLGAERDRPEEQ